MAKPKQSNSRKYLINTISCVTYRVLQMSVLVWVNQYLIKRIPTEEYSLYPLVLSLVLFGDLFKSVFTGGIARFLVEAHAQQDKEKITTITSSMVPVLLGAAAVIMGATVLAAWNIERLIEVDASYVGSAQLMLLLLGGTLAANVVSTPFQTGLYVRQNFVAINVIELATELLRITVLLVLLFGVGVNVVWLVVASTVSGLTLAASMTVATIRTLPDIRFARKSICWKQAKTLLSFSSWTFTEYLSGIAVRALPLLFLNRYTSAVGVTQYHLANLADMQVKRLLAAATRPVQPALTAMHALGKSDLLKELYYRGGRYHVWILLIPAGPIMLYGTDLMGLYAGNEFREAGYVLMAFFLRYPFTYASAMYYRLAHAAGKVRTYYVCDAFLQGIIIVSMYVVLRFGGGGAVAAAWCASIAQSVFHLLVIWPLGLAFVGGSWVNFIRKTLAPGYLPFIVSTLVCLAMKQVLVVTTWNEIFLAFAVGVLVNIVVIGLLCLVTSDRVVYQKIYSFYQRRIMRQPVHP